MAKLFDIFNERSSKLYRAFPTKDDPSDKTSEPFVYVYPDKVKGDIASDSQLSPKSVSVLRDRVRINSFENSARGDRFLDTQQFLQRGNTWAQTRNYRKENISEHVEPLAHKQRHGFKFSLQTLKSKDVVIGYENDGKLQGETSDFLLSSTGPVYVRLNSKGGMLNQRLSLVDIVAGNVRSRISSKINKWLSPINKVVSDARARISDNSIADRPEINSDYIKQVYDANKGVLSGVSNHTFGHIYFPVDTSIGTYQDNFNNHPGFFGYEQLKPTPRDRKNYVSDLFSKLEGRVSGFLDRTLSRFGLGSNSFLSSFLPKANDINLIRNLRRFVGDIDDVINNVRNFSNNFGLKKIDLVPVNLLEKYKQSDHNSDLQNIYASATKDVDEFKRQVANYLGSGKIFSIGSGVEDGTVIHTINSVNIDRNGYPDSRYLKNFRYKDLIQRKVSIYKKDIDKQYDVDIIDVIFQIKDTGNAEQDDQVRFRAFLSDVTETVTPTYNENKYIGRYETFYTYNKVTRDVNFVLTLQAFSKQELTNVIGKMSYLTSLAYPTNVNSYLTPTICKFTIGDLYYRQPCILQGVSHTIENEASWDIDHQLPMTIQVSIKLRLLDKKTHRPNDNKIYGEFTVGLRERSEGIPTITLPTLDLHESFAKFIDTGTILPQLSSNSPRNV